MSPANQSEPTDAPSWLDEPLTAREHPLRFMWQMDAEGRFSLGSDEFTRLIGAHTAAGFGRRWSEIAETFGLDPDGRVARAVATGSTWSGITLDWPVDGGGRLPVELAGLPIYDHTGKLAGYRGFGVCRDLDGLTRLAAQRRTEFVSAPPEPQALSADIIQAGPASDSPAAVVSEDIPADIPAVASSTTPELPASIAIETSHQTDLETPVESTETLKNVLPFRPISEPKSPVLTPVENSAFNELARQLSARLEAETSAAATPDLSDASEDIFEPAVVSEPRAEAPVETPEWLAQPEPPARGETRRDRMLLDLVPVGVLIYRLDRLLYANSAFLARIGYDSLQALEEAGGLDALYVEPGVSTASSTSDTGTPVTISASQASQDSQDSSDRTPSPATDARLYTIAWDEDSALALICSGAAGEGAAIAAAITQAVPASEPSAVGHANAEELGAILDTTAEGIVMFDGEGNINSCNRSAEALFGYDGADLVQRNLSELFAPESQRVVQDYLESIKGAGVASLLDHGRDMLGRVRGGGIIPLSMTMGRTRPDGPNFFAVFRDLSQARKNESELQQARRLAERAANAKADMLARISHEVRTPLNAIIGFAEVMIGERFGSLGNERYVEYMKDIRASGERVIAIINDLLDLSQDRDRQARSGFHQPEPQRAGGELRRGDAAAGQPRTHHHPDLAGACAAIRDRRRPRAAPDHAEPDRQLDPSRQCRRPGHRLHRAVGFRRGDVAGPRYRTRAQRQRGRRRDGAVPQPCAVRSVLRRLRRQPVADQGAGRSQPRAIPHQDRPAFGHADRSGVFPRGGEGVSSSWTTAA